MSASHHSFHVFGLQDKTDERVVAAFKQEMQRAEDSGSLPYIVQVSSVPCLNLCCPEDFHMLPG
jgi:hypothetical protein